MTQARVGSVDSIKDFRVQLVKFQEACSLALGDAESDINRTVSWLETQQLSFWQMQIRKRHEALQRAEDALRQKRIYKDSSGRTPSAVDEQKAVELAKRRLAHAEERMNNTKRWVRQVQREIVLYRGGVARFSSDISSVLPNAISQLGSLIENLEKYVGLGPAPLSGEMSEISAGAFSDNQSSGPSMSRPTEEVKEPEAPIDPIKLRALIDEKAIGEAKAAPAGMVTLSCPLVDANVRQVILGLAMNQPEIRDIQPVVLCGNSAMAESIALIRSVEPDIWVMIPLDQKPEEPYNTVQAGDLLTGRPDLAEILRLPIGYLATVSSAGVMIFDKAHQKLWPE